MISSRSNHPAIQHHDSQPYHNDNNQKFHCRVMSTKAALCIISLSMASTFGFFPHVVSSYQSPLAYSRLRDKRYKKRLQFCDGVVHRCSTRHHHHHGVASRTYPNLDVIALLMGNSIDEAATNNNNDNFEKNETKRDNEIDLEQKPHKIKDLMKRVTQLERLVSNQAVQIRKLKQECRDLSEAAATFAQVIELLRQAGLTATDHPPGAGDTAATAALSSSSKSGTAGSKKGNASETGKEKWDYEFDDSEIFGTAPSSVIDAADAAGAAILAAMLGGKLRMLVDVRDAELSRDPDILVQFIELAILPVAAGLEGLNSHRNRVKIVFPTVSQLLQYRKTMALAAPEVVSLSTLGFDAVEDRDNLVVIIAPSPDDEEGVAHMLDLLDPQNAKQQLQQPVVVLNHHMVPVSGPVADFEVAYHLRLLSVQYMTGDMNPEYVQQLSTAPEQAEGTKAEQLSDDKDNNADVTTSAENITARLSTPTSDEDQSGGSDEDAALEAAMEHAHETGVHQGITRAMVIRAYPKPWHVFVDTSPDADADFEVAATFDQEPSQDDVNYAIVECLEGSEREDELVAQQMQEALDSGQLSRVSEMLLGILPTAVDEDGPSYPQNKTKENDENNDDDDDYDVMKEDSC